MHPQVRAGARAGSILACPVHQVYAGADRHGTTANLNSRWRRPKMSTDMEIAYLGAASLVEGFRVRTLSPGRVRCRGLALLPSDHGDPTAHYRGHGDVRPGAVSRVAGGGFPRGAGHALRRRQEDQVSHRIHGAVQHVRTGAVSVNCGFTENRRPSGVQISARRLDELGVLRAAQRYEQHRPIEETPAWPQTELVPGRWRQQ